MAINKWLESPHVTKTMELGSNSKRTIILTNTTHFLSAITKPTKERPYKREAS